MPPIQVRWRAAVRRAIQSSQESLRALSKRYGINPKTVAKWRKWTAVKDMPTGPRDPRSVMLTIGAEANIVVFRKHTLLPLDDCLYAPQTTIPILTHSSLHRCLQRHGTSRLPKVTADKLEKYKFKAYLIGYFHIDIAEIRTAGGKRYLSVAIDRTSKFPFIQFTFPPCYKDGPAATCMPHMFDMRYQENGIQDRLTKVKHPWTNW